MWGERLIFCILFLVACGYSTDTCSAQAGRSPYQALRLPSPQKFPTRQELLLQYRDGQDVKKIREHAWDLFAGLTRDSPVWETWFTKCEVHLETQKCPKLIDQSNRHRLFRGFEIPVQFIHELVLTPKAPGRLVAPGASSDPLPQVFGFAKDFGEHPQFASVLYNREAANHILHNKLYSKSVLDELNNARLSSQAPDAEREIPSFPAGSVVLKTAWQVVYERKGNHTGPLYVWDPEIGKAMQAVGKDQAKDPSQFGSSVTIDTTPGRRCNDVDYRDLVPLSCFYYYKIKSKQDLKSLPTSLAIFAGSDPPAAENAYFVLVAVHVTTKETPDWVWATFWWSNRATQGPFAFYRPSGLQGEWRHFLMDTTLSEETPHDSDGGNKICFNPYLEAKFNNGIVSNCIQCHKRAIYPGKNNGYALGLPWRDGNAANEVPPDPHYYEGSVRTDFLWSITTPQNPDFTKFLNQLQQLLEQR
jgi:hypothetical protein